MSNSKVQAGIWMLIGMALMGIIVWFTMPSLMLFEHKSDKNYADTISALNEVIAQKENWKVPMVFDYQENIVDAGHGPIDRVGTVSLCNPLYASMILEDDENRKVTPFMPLGIGVYEDKEGNVYISELNVGLLGMMFGGKISEVMGLAGKDIKDIISAVTNE